MKKRIRDPIHGYVELDDNILKIVDNEFFQRLRYIKQNGWLTVINTFPLPLTFLLLHLYRT